MPLAGSLLITNGRGYAWGPVVDGVIVPAQPSDVGVKVPSIFGSNMQDGSIFVLGQYPTPQLNQSDWEEFLSYNFGEFAGAINQTITPSQFAATPFPVFYAMSSVITDMTYRCPAYRGAMKAAANNIPVWTYSFNHTPSCDWLTSLPQKQSLLQLAGAAHTAELPFVWGQLTQQPAGTGNCSLNAAERNMSAWIVKAWTGMAENGYPGLSWPNFNPNTSMGINFNDEPEVGIIDYTICSKFWDTIEKGILSADSQRTTRTNDSSTSPSTSISNSAAAPFSVALASAFIVTGFVFLA